MSKYLKLILLMAFGVSFLGADDFSMPTSEGATKLKEIKAKVNSEQENYNYVVTHNARENRDLERERGDNIGVSLSNNHHREVINVVKISEYHDREKYLADKDKYKHHSSSNPDKNLGIQHRGNANHTSMTNIVEISDSELEGSVNTGISISDDDFIDVSIYSETTITDSSIGDD